jgi:hypothetical protein
MLLVLIVRGIRCARRVRRMLVLLLHEVLLHRTRGEADMNAC